MISSIFISRANWPAIFIEGAEEEEGQHVVRTQRRMLDDEVGSEEEDRVCECWALQLALQDDRVPGVLVQVMVEKLEEFEGGSKAHRAEVIAEALVMQDTVDGKVGGPCIVDFDAWIRLAVFCLEIYPAIHVKIVVGHLCFWERNEGSRPLIDA